MCHCALAAYTFQFDFLAVTSGCVCMPLWRCPHASLEASALCGCLFRGVRMPLWRCLNHPPHTPAGNADDLLHFPYVFLSLSLSSILSLSPIQSLSLYFRQGEWGAKLIIVINNYKIIINIIK